MSARSTVAQIVNDADTPGGPPLDPAVDFDAPDNWRPHPLDIRVSLPLLSGWYVAVVSGRERRSPERRAREWQKRPPGTSLNRSGAVILGLFVGLATFGFLQIASIVTQRGLMPGG